MPLIYKTAENLIAARNGESMSIPLGLDSLFAADDPFSMLATAMERGSPCGIPASLQAPLESQEVWAAGVTYFRSRTARMEESKRGGGADFYEKVYDAERPELFFKA